MTAHAHADEQLRQLAVASGVLTAEAGAAGGMETGRVLELLAGRFHLGVVDLSQVRVAPEVLRLVPRELAARHRLLPFARDGETLRVALGDPWDTDGTDSLAHLLGLSIEPVLAAPSDILRAIDQFYGKKAGQPDELRVPPSAAVLQSADPVKPTAADADAPIIKLVHGIIVEAVQRRASAIHLELLERRLRIRYRIDGVLQETENPPKRLQLAIISRLKIMANISIAEKRLPQDGRIQISVGGRPLDLRVSSLPTAHGESIVMRILDQENLKLGLSEMGLLEDDRVTLERLITLPDGILLVTGPTGSGKTTTLYACLHHINQPNRKIITVEDPVEYQLNGINQVPVRQEVGMTFASALRAMLRQSPNVVMVGEIRDLETAEIAINASLTGHMVFSTLHTNDAPGAVTRLIDLGTKPYLVSTSFRGVMAQRLVRRICPTCSRQHEPTAQELHLLTIDPALAVGANFRRGAGCPDCRGTGYFGRMGIFEIFTASDVIRGMIHAGATAAQLREKARAEGMRTMREDGVRKIIAGLTTVEEVVSITVADAN
jgi:general secretion pathway protein E/type IV pilus assembly protein PilB